MGELLRIAVNGEAREPRRRYARGLVVSR